MATRLASLVVDLRTNSAKFVQGIQKANRELQSLRRSADRMGRALATMRTGLVGVAGAAGVGSLIKLANDSLAAAANIDLVAKKVGVSVEALQELRFAAKQAGITTQTLDMALQRFSRRIGEAAQGKGELVQVLRQYGIAVRDAEGRTRRTEDVLLDLAEAIRQAGSDQEKLRIAFKAFDSEGAALVNILRDGAVGLEEVRKKARDLGVVMERDLVESARRASEEMEAFTAVIEAKAIVGIARLANHIRKLFGIALNEREKAFKRMGDLRKWRDQLLELVARPEANPEWVKTARQSIQQINEELIKLQRFVEGGAPGKKGPDQAVKVVDPVSVTAQASAVQTLIDRLREEAATLGMSREETILYRLEKEGATAAQLSQARALVESIQAEREFERALERSAQEARQQAIEQQQLNRELEMQARRWLDAINPMNRYQRDLEELERLLNAGRLTWEQYADAVLTASDAYEEISEEAKKTRDIGEDLGWTFSSAFEDAILQARSFRDVLRGLAQDIARIIIRRTIAEPIAAAVSSWVGGLFKNQHGGLYRVAGPSGEHPVMLSAQRGETIAVAPRGQGIGGEPVNVTVNMRVESLDPSRAADVVAGALVELKPVVTGIVDEAYRRRGRPGPLGA